ncbi:hypothetical protein EK21DRAFT_112457 [Setomelanomma holmii]|uniref:Uncharacterized protein n=1 Tax=Setomelanomma holmii TaxID=210430 RepID=A0A9P4H8B5_9PLEO|nr:hypothetical protein EK21DRAFT_112457 [Setomelanomma holmii]
MLNPQLLAPIEVLHVPVLEIRPFRIITMSNKGPIAPFDLVLFSPPDTITISILLAFSSGATISSFELFALVALLFVLDTGTYICSLEVRIREFSKFLDDATSLPANAHPSKNTLGDYAALQRSYKTSEDTIRELNATIVSLTAKNNKLERLLATACLPNDSDFLLQQITEGQRKVFELSWHLERLQMVVTVLFLGLLAFLGGFDLGKLGIDTQKFEAYIEYARAMAYGLPCPLLPQGGFRLHGIRFPLSGLGIVGTHIIEVGNTFLAHGAFTRAPGGRDHPADRDDLPPIPNSPLSSELDTPSTSPTKTSAEVVNFMAFQPSKKPTTFGTRKCCQPEFAEHNLEEGVAIFSVGKKSLSHI